MREVDWSVAVTASLMISKKAGWSHEHAWRIAVKAYPPPRPRRIGGDEVQLSLVGDDGADYDEASHAEFFKEATRQAFEGERPALKHFTMELVGDRDDTEFARSSNAWRAA